METHTATEPQPPSQEELLRLKQQIIISQVVQAAGCTPDQALSLLQTANWDSQMAMSLFFQEIALPQAQGQQHLGPANTPATPNLLPDALSAFAALQTGSPAEGGNVELLMPIEHVSQPTQPVNPFLRTN